MKKKHQKKIVIYGGAFNPPHLGHASVIKALLHLFPCDEIWIMPSGERKDKRIGVSGQDRLAMLRLMSSELFKGSIIPIKISDLELHWPRLSATYETLKTLAELHPRNKFYFYIGSRLIKDIKTEWVQGKKLYDTANFISAIEPRSSLPKKLPKSIIFLDAKKIEWLSISSTFVRGLLRRGRSGTPYITPGVARYIKKHKLYQ